MTAKIERTYSAYDDFKGRHALDIEAYIKDVVVREKRMDDGIVGDRSVLLHAILVAEHAGKFIDLIKKMVVYGKAIDAADLMVALDKLITEAQETFDVVVGTTGHAQAIPVNARLLHAALGGFGEQAEMLTLLREQIENSGSLDVASVVDERGDQTWYGALSDDEIARLRGVTVTQAIDDTLVGNTKKLELRHGAKFDPSHAKNREAEMAAVKEAL